MHPALPWLRLSSANGIGPLRFRRLVSHFGSPDAVLGASRSQLLASPGISDRLADAICHVANAASAPFLDEIRLAETQGVRLLCLGTESYPPLLSEIADPPPVLYIRGNFPTDGAAVSIVGSRNATRYGCESAHRLAGDLSRAGLMVISGMARGIDAAAHEGALAAKGTTIAVLGCGLSRVYPPEHGRLAQEIAANGAIVSEYPMAARPDAAHFPARNRIIAGLSLGTAVIEAADRSGSLITARLAAEQGREVFAMPGSTRSSRSVGTHRLLRQGAKLLETASDILEEFPGFSAPFLGNQTDCVEKSLDLTESTVFKALDPYPVHIDDIARRIGMATGPLSAVLLKLEIAGKVVQYPGKYFAQTEDPS